MASIEEELNDPTEATGSSSSSVGRKVAIGVAGCVVTAAGVVMLVTPGPGIIAILSGLGILGSEFPAARNVLRRLRHHSRDDDQN